MRDYRKLSAEVFVGECIEMKMKWLGRQLRSTNVADEIEIWVRKMTLLTDLLLKLKNVRRPSRRVNLEIHRTAPIGVLGVKPEEEEGLSGIEMDIEELKDNVRAVGELRVEKPEEADKLSGIAMDIKEVREAVPPRVELEEDYPVSDHGSPLAESYIDNETLNDDEDYERYATGKELEELHSNINEGWKQWEVLHSTLNEEEKRWWELLKGHLEGLEEVGDMERKENVQRIITALIAKVESVLNKKLTRIPRQRRSILWRVLKEGAQLLLIEKKIGITKEEDDRNQGGGGNEQENDDKSLTASDTKYWRKELKSKRDDKMDVRMGEFFRAARRFGLAKNLRGIAGSLTQTR